MSKQTLENIKTIIVNEYLNKKDEIFEEEKADIIDSKRAEEKRNKLIGMMTAVEIIQREIKKQNFENTMFEHDKYKIVKEKDNPLKYIKIGIILAKIEFGNDNEKLWYFDKEDFLKHVNYQLV